MVLINKFLDQLDLPFKLSIGTFSNYNSQVAGKSFNNTEDWEEPMLDAANAILYRYIEAAADIVFYQTEPDSTLPCLRLRKILYCTRVGCARAPLALT